MTDAAAFEPHRGFLIGVAYRMLGSVSDAEDVVQDAYLRWQGADRAAVDDVRAYLARIVARLCLDRLKSARTRREHYVGTWLPEPLVEETSEPSTTAMADDLSVALMLTLERLSPLERAAFLLHDVFDMDYSAIAGVLERTEAACRQLAARAREHVRDGRPRFEPSPETEERIASAFAAAAARGDVDALASLLAEDAVMYSDGGGKRVAAIHPIIGRERIMRFFAGVLSKPSTPVPFEVRATRINGLPGYVLRDETGVQTVTLELRDDHIAAIYVVRNPDKLRHLS